VSLDGPWDRAEGAALHERCRTQLARARKPAALSLLVRPGDSGLPESLPWAPESQPGPGLVVCYSSTQDLGRATAFLTRPFGGSSPVPPVLPESVDTVPREGLRADPRLHNPLTLKRGRVTVAQVLEQLAAATGLEMTADPEMGPERVVFDSVLWHNTPAWDAMSQVAQAALVRGQWEKLPSGYRLRPTAETPSLRGTGPPLPARGTSSFWVILNWALLLILLVALLFWRLRKRRVRSDSPDALTTEPAGSAREQAADGC
jgi:hypothetical protein